MEQQGFDRDRMLMYTVLLGGLVSIGLYVMLYLTLAIYGPLNASGILIGRVALFVSGGILGIALVLALTARSASLSSARLSGWGWFLVFGGIALLFPAMGAASTSEVVPGLTSFGGFAGAIFVLLAGGLLVQAERTARERQAANQGGAESAEGDPQLRSPDASHLRS